MKQHICDVFPGDFLAVLDRVALVQSLEDLALVHLLHSTSLEKGPDVGHNLRHLVLGVSVTVYTLMGQIGTYFSFSCRSTFR